MKKTTKKIVIVSFIILFLVVGLTIVFISPLTKYLVQKYDEKYTGREITMDWAYVNPFTGYFHFSNLKIHELKSDSLFFSSDNLKLNISLLKLISSTIEISELTLDHPIGTVIQNKNDFNYTDLIEKFMPDKLDTTVSGWRFSILKVKIEGGEIHYLENQIPINYFVKELNIESSGMQWDVDTVAGTFSFLSGIGTGSVKGDFNVNLKTKNYKYDLVVKKFDLNIIEQYMKELANYGTFRANLDADIKAIGNINDERDVTLKGMLAINDFHFGKDRTEDYLSWDKFVMAIKDLSPNKHLYIYDSVALIRPYFKYEMYDSTDNLQAMFGKDGANVSAVADDNSKFNLIIEIARTVKVMARNFFQSYYRINRLAIYDGDLKFNDFSLNEKFSAKLDPFNFIADSIDKNRTWVTASLKSGIKPFGDASVSVKINPKDTGDFDMQYNFRNISAASFNPYLISYTSFPVDRGKIELNGTWNVRNGEIKSVNHLLVIDPRVTKRVKKKHADWIPLPLIFSFIREYGNVIDYEIPITGSFKNPKFHLKDVIFDLIGNIFVKPAKTAYRMEVKEVEYDIEKSLTFKWPTLQTSILSSQEKFVNKIESFLADNPQASITIYPKQYEAKEKEYILFFEAKKKYYMALKEKGDDSFDEGDSLKVNSLSVRDTKFNNYLDNILKDTMLFTIQEKCSKLVGQSIVNFGFNKLKAARADSFKSSFKKEVLGQIKIMNGENIIPFNGFSFYKIEYSGAIPKSLQKAYEELQVLNEEAPRNKYLRGRP